MSLHDRQVRLLEVPGLLLLVRSDPNLGIRLREAREALRDPGRPESETLHLIAPPRGVTEQVFRHHRDHVCKSVRRSFDRQQRRCTVYAARPSVCRRYPSGAHCGYYAFLSFEREQQGDDQFVPFA